MRTLSWCCGLILALIVPARAQSPSENLASTNTTQQHIKGYVDHVPAASEKLASIDNIRDLLKAKVAKASIIWLIRIQRQTGFSYQVDAKTLDELIAEGADGKIILEMLSPKPSIAEPIAPYKQRKMTAPVVRTLDEIFAQRTATANSEKTAREFVPDNSGKFVPNQPTAPGAFMIAEEDEQDNEEPAEDEMDAEEDSSARSIVRLPSRKAEIETLRDDDSAPLFIVPRANYPAVSAPVVRPNAYGLGLNEDPYGRPHTYRLQDGTPLDPIFQGDVKRNGYGLGVHQDQFGRPVYDSTSP